MSFPVYHPFVTVGATATCKNSKSLYQRGVVVRGAPRVGYLKSKGYSSPSSSSARNIQRS